MKIVPLFPLTAATSRSYRAIAIALAIGGSVCAAQTDAATPPDKSDGADKFAKEMDAYLAKEANIEKLMNTLQGFAVRKQQEMQKKAAQEEEKAVDAQFQNPVKVDIAGSPMKGDPNAKVTIVEFSDFECPYCRVGFENVEQLLKDYPKDVRVVFKHFPLAFHQKAGPASKAAIAAGEQGKFWEMYELLFKNQQKLGSEPWNDFAKELGLNLDKFKADMASPETAKKLEADLALGKSLGVEGTPGFFVNGVQVKGARPVPYFKGLIDRWLKQGK